MKWVQWLALSLVLACLVPAGCRERAEAPKVKVYDIKGKVIAVDADKKMVTLDHEEIPGYMQAMEMEFSVETATPLGGLKPGDQVQGKLKVTSDGYTITELHKR